MYNDQSNTVAKLCKMLSTRLPVCLICFLVCDTEVLSEKVEPAFVKWSTLSPNTCLLPNELSVTISTGELDQTFTLKLSQLPEEDTPVHTVQGKEGGRIVTEEQHSLQESGYYVDGSGSTSLEVVCTLREQKPRFEMRGHVVFSNGNIYDLEPSTDPDVESGLEPEDDAHDPRPRERRHAELHDPEKELQAAQNVHTRASNRHKRNTDDINIDTVVLIGYSEYQRWLDRTAGTNTTLRRLEALGSIRQYFALLFNSVQLRFTSASTRYNINLVGFFIEDARESEWVTRVREMQGNETRLDGQLMLDAIWNWTRNATDFPKNDVIVAYESLSLYSFQESAFQRDFSYNSTICSERGKHVVLVSVNDVVAFDMLSTTHGLGHALGAEDDGPPNNCSSEDHYIMARDYPTFHQLDHNNPYYFSNCSLQSMDDYIHNLMGASNWSRSCFLESLTSVDAPNVTDVLPGQVYDPDAQCRLLYGTQSYYCFNQGGLSHNDICKRMLCYNPSQRQCYYYYAAEGTTCGHKKWCQDGECVFASDAAATDEECIHGDQTSINCASIAATLPYYCYYSNVEVLCCQSCKDVRGPDKGCPFGDNDYVEPNCQYSNCNTTSDTDFVDNCCNTCIDFRPTTTVTMTTELTTTTTPTSTGPTTTMETASTSAAATMLTTSNPAATTMTTTTTPTATTMATTTASNMMTSTTPTSSTMTTTTTSAATTMTTTSTLAATTMAATTTPTATTMMTTTASTMMTSMTSAATTMTTTSTPTSTTITTTTATTMTTTTSPTATTMTTATASNMMTSTTPTSSTITTTTTSAATTMTTTSTPAVTTMTTTTTPTATTMTTTTASTMMTSMTSAATTMTTTSTPTSTTITTTTTAIATTMAATTMTTTSTPTSSTITVATTPTITELRTTTSTTPIPTTLSTLTVATTFSTWLARTTTSSSLETTTTTATRRTPTTTTTSFDITQTTLPTTLTTTRTTSSDEATTSSRHPSSETPSASASTSPSTERTSSTTTNPGRSTSESATATIEATTSTTPSSVTATPTTALSTTTITSPSAQTTATPTKGSSHHGPSTTSDDKTTSAATEISSMSPSTTTKDGQKGPFGTSSPGPEKTTPEKTFSNLPATSDRMKMTLGLGVGLGVVGLVVVGLFVYRVCLAGRADSAAISTPEWTSLTPI